MKFTSADFAKIQFHLLAAIIMVALGVAAVLGARSVSNTATLTLNAAKAEQGSYATKLRQANQEESEIKRKSAKLKQLETRGIVGPEDRLEWAELLNSVRDKRRLIDLQYEISPQRTLDPAPTASFNFNASAMRLELKLLHEEDLTRLINDLRNQARALILVRNCTLSRLPRGSGDGSNNAQLNAQCGIDWVTVHEAATKP